MSEPDELEDGYRGIPTKAHSTMTAQHILPCPNPKCRGTCVIRMGGWARVECTRVCGYHGPYARTNHDDDAEAIRLHNDMPREAELVSVESSRSCRTCGDAKLKRLAERYRVKVAVCEGFVSAAPPHLRAAHEIDLEVVKECHAAIVAALGDVA